MKCSTIIKSLDVQTQLSFPTTIYISTFIPCRKPTSVESSKAHHTSYIKTKNTSPMDKSSSEGNDPKPEDEKKNYFQMVDVEGIGHLPRDLVIEILSRLPAKDLCKLRCVSKSWNVLLSRDIEFIAQHIQWWKQKPLLLVRRYLSDGTGEPSKTRITIEFTSIDMHGDIIDKFEKQIDGPVHTFISCGPLTLLCCMYSLYVCNPSIHKIVRVPFPSSSRLYNTGFGFLPSSNEYKVVHMFRGSEVENGKVGCEVFSFPTGGGVSSSSWRRIRDCPSSAWIDEYLLCVSGAIYWVISCGWKEKSILSLDLKTEEFSTISYPIQESKTEYSFLEYIGLAGSLCVVGFSAEASRMDIWMLKDKRKGRWSVEHSINLFPWCPKFLIPRDEEILVQMEGMDMICYSLKSGRMSRTGCYYKAMKTYNKPCLYYNSLVPMY